MKKYELTERGKIIICVILVLLIFILPATIFAVKAWSNAPPPEDPPRSSAPEPEDTVVSDRPLPDGSGFNPLDPAENENGEQGSFDPPVNDAIGEPEFGPLNLDLAGGTMQFRFSPELQDSLDDDTISMLGEFIKSPMNTDRTQIVVEMPQLSEDNTSLLITAITEAFAMHGVRQEALAYVALQTNPDEDERSFEVKVAFLPKGDQK